MRFIHPKGQATSLISLYYCGSFVSSLPPHKGTVPRQYWVRSKDTIPRAGRSINPDLLRMSQPLHPSIVPRLDEEYRDFHNSHLINIVPPHTLPWSPDIRNAPAVPGGSTPLPVHITRDIALTHTKCRVFVPHGDPPENGWPAFIFFHGGMPPAYLTLYS
jgi:hypothetical protein